MNRPCFAGILFLAACCASQFGGASTQPDAATSQPSRARSSLDAARDAARADLANGVLRIRLAIPEAFLLEWRDPDSEDRDLLDYYDALLADRYGIRFDWVMFNAASPEQRAKAAAYDDVMIPAIVKKFGSDVTDPAWKEACNATHAARAKYLAERRVPSIQPATRPAAPPRSNTRAS